MSTIAQTARLTSAKDNKLQVVQFGIVRPDAQRRAVIYINRPIHVVDRLNKVKHDETKFHRLPNVGIVADHGVANDLTLSVVETLEYFVRHPFDRYSGVRILRAFDNPAYASKIVFKIGHDHVVEAACYVIAMLVCGSGFASEITYLDSDTPSDIESQDRDADKCIPVYAMHTMWY